MQIAQCYQHKSKKRQTNANGNCKMFPMEQPRGEIYSSGYCYLPIRFGILYIL